MRRRGRVRPAYAGPVTSAFRTLAALSGATALLVLTACTSTPAPEATASDPGEGTVIVDATIGCQDGEGITVVVDAGALGDADSASLASCILAEGGIAAADALSLAGIDTEGTRDYGDQVVCRVNGVPAADLAITADDGSEYFESCDSMPAAFAYWSLWVKPAGGAWDYAQEGLSTLRLEPGDSLELLFTLNGEPAEPAA